MGPSLARRVRRAADAAGKRQPRDRGVAFLVAPRRARASKPTAFQTVACDLLDPGRSPRCPRCPNVLFLAGPEVRHARSDRHHLDHQHRRAGTRRRALRPVAHRGVLDRKRLPARAGRRPGVQTKRTRRRRSANTRNPASGASASSSSSRASGACAALIFRLNYAVDLRYGTLVDIARKVSPARPVDLTVGYFNAIWQGDANSYALRSLELCASPPAVLNVTGPERISRSREPRVVRRALRPRAPVRGQRRAGRAAQRLEPLPRAAGRACVPLARPAAVGGALGGDRRRTL